MRSAQASRCIAPYRTAQALQSLAEEGDIDTLISWMHHLPPSTDPSRIDLQINLAGTGALFPL